VGQLYVSTDDWKTVRAPVDVPADIPNAKFDESSDDGGRPHAAHRVHRRIIELPNGDLLSATYGWLQGDATPSTYAKTMMKSRCMLRTMKCEDGIASGLVDSSQALAKQTSAET
jgi:hypothetical protein